MYEKQVDAAPKGSQQHAAWTVGGDLVEVLRGIGDALEAIEKSLHKAGKAIPAKKPIREKGPGRRVDVGNYVDATLKDPINE
jgi:hypothetical protein